MTRGCSIVALLWWMTEVALGTPQVASVRVQRQGNRVNVRVTAFNRDSRWRGPLDIRLYVRPGRWCPWLLVRDWAGQSALGPGQKLCRDLFDENSALLGFLAVGALQVKAVVAAPGLSGVVECSLPARR